MNLSAAFIPIVPTGKPQVGQYWCSVAQLDPQWGQILETDCWLVTTRGSRKVILSRARRHASRASDALGPKHHPKQSKGSSSGPRAGQNAVACSFSMSGRVRLGDLLVSAHIISRDKVEAVLTA